MCIGDLRKIRRSARVKFRMLQYRRKKMSFQRECSLCRILVHAETNAADGEDATVDILWKSNGVIVAVLSQTELPRILDTWMTPQKKYGDMLCWSPLC